MIKVLDFWSLETLNYGTNNIVIVLNIKNKLYNGHFASIINDKFLYSKKTLKNFLDPDRRGHAVPFS